MPADTFSWLHLTDLHFGLKGQGWLWLTLRQPFLDDLALLHDRCGPWDAVLFTGDLVQSGQSAQFQGLQEQVLGPLWEQLTRLGSGDTVLVAVPGNHDLFRPNAAEDNAAIDALLDPDQFPRIAAKFWGPPDGGYRRVVNQAFAAWRDWWDGASHRPAGIATGALPGDLAVTIAKGGRRIGLMGLNTAFLQLGAGDYQGKLVWDPRQVQALCPNGIDRWHADHDLCLLLTHQGPDWLTPEARAQGDSEIAPAGRFALHLFGHMHEARLEAIRRGANPEAVRLCQGCSVFGMEHFGEPPRLQRAHGYSAGQVRFADSDGGTGPQLRLWPRVATNRTGPWRLIPDQENFHLEPDQGTQPEPLTQRRRPDPAATTPTDAPTTPPRPAPHSTLPRRQPFFGRLKELADIAAALEPTDRSWGLGLVGPGGIGKTALALEAAHRAPAERFPLKLWVTAKGRELDPEGVRPLSDQPVHDFDSLLAELGRALASDAIPRSDPAERATLVRHALAGQRALLVIDNLETLNTAERQRVFDLLRNLPDDCRALVTSRRASGASPGNWLALDRLDRAAADALLAELARRWPPVGRLNDADRARLYAETAGNPLLLTWTVGQLGLDRGRCHIVDDAIDRLQQAHRHNDPLAFIFGDLVDGFTADETAVLAALVHFSEPAPLPWLLPLTTQSPTAARTALDDLRDRSLLLTDDDRGTWLLTALAARFLRRVRPELVAATGERLAERAYALAQENGYQQHDRFPTLEAAWPELAAALPVLIGGANRRLQGFCDALQQFLDFSGRWDDKLALSLAAESRALAADDHDRAGWRVYDAGRCHLLRCNAEGVLDCAGRAAAHWEQSQAGARERAVAIRLCGEGHRLAKDYPAAIAASHEALELYRGLSPRSVDVAAGLNSLARALWAAGYYDEAEGYCREALAIARDLPDPECVAAYTGNLAELALDREDWPAAERLAREALALDEPLGRKQLIAAHSQRLAKALARQGRGAEGRCHAERAVALFTELRSPDLAEAQATLAECRA
jgi:tetratricopeptide (TPR) repeat protein